MTQDIKVVKLTAFAILGVLIWSITGLFVHILIVGIGVVYAVIGIGSLCDRLECERLHEKTELLNSEIDARIADWTARKHRENNIPISSSQA